MCSSYRRNSVSVIHRGKPITSEVLFNFDSEYKSRMFYLLLAELAREIEGELKDE